MHKFDVCARQCIFFGYPPSQKGYRVYDLDTEKFFTSRDVVFHEHIFPFSTSPQENQSDYPVLPAPFDEDAPSFTVNPQTPITSSSSSHDHSSPSDTTIPHETSQNDSPSSIDIFLDTEPTSTSSQNQVPHRRSHRSIKPPAYLQDYQVNHALLLAPRANSSTTSSTKYPLNRLVKILSGWKQCRQNFRFLKKTTHGP